MSDKIQVSIIIPVYNKFEYTIRCLEKIYANTNEHFCYEIIVVDNGSTDKTKENLTKLSQEIKNLIYLPNDENLKFAKACNIGAINASGEYLVFLNNDTEPKPGWLTYAIQRLQSDPEIGIVGSKLLYPDNTIQHCGIEFFEHETDAYQFWPLHRHIRSSADLPEANKSEVVDAVTGACLFISKKLFDEVNGFDESYGMYFEDLDLNFKVRKAGYKIFYEPKSIVIHYEGVSSSNQIEIDKLNRKAARIFFSKWSQDLFKYQLYKHFEFQEGNIHVFNENIYPELDTIDLTDNIQLQNIQNSISGMLTKINSIEENYVHFGGAGDALLLLSTFYDENPEQTIVSFANSIKPLTSFWKAFPKLKKIYLFPVPTDSNLHIILRNHFKQSSKVLGTGATPVTSYFKEWVNGIDIFSTYGIKANPLWAKNFSSEKIPAQIAVAPMGSMVGMVGSKKNIIDPAIWGQLIKYLLNLNFKVVILGTPLEEKDYPCYEGCSDQRSYSFAEQMKIIASSQIFIGADSWGKTFAALAGIPTLVFKSLFGEDLKGWKDNSDFIFLDPWKEITTVNNFHEFTSTFEQLINHSNPENSAISINWNGPQFVNHSLALVNRELCSLILNSGFNLSVNKTEPDQFKPSRGSKFYNLRKVENQNPDNININVFHHWPPSLVPPDDGHWVVIQPWEYGSLPESWVEVFSNSVDELWVPSNYVKQVYVKSGVSSEKVFVIPNGFDPDVFNPQVKPFKIKTNKKFKFLFVGGTIFRKGIDVLLNAIIKAFTAKDDVCLIIKDMGNNSFYKGQTLKEKITALSENKNLPEIIYLDKNLNEKELAGLYTASDVLVHPYRGEGFGLPILEAMANWNSGHCNKGWCLG